MDKIKILVTASTFPRFQNDSAPRFILDICKSIESNSNFECLVLSPHSEGSAVNEVLEGIKVKRYRYMYPCCLEEISGMGMVTKIRKNRLLLLMVPFFIISQIISTIITIKNYKPDILIANWIIPQGFIAYIMKLIFPGLKVIMVARGGDIGLIQNSSVLKIVSRFILRKADRIISVSNFLKNRIMEISGLNKDKIYVISSGVDIDIFEQARLKKSEENVPAKRNILFIGRLEEKKGINYLLKALTRVVKIYPDVKLTITGDGSEKEYLMKLTQELELSDNVRFQGAVEHGKIPVFFQEALLFAAPSINLNYDIEGLPTIIMEAIAAKVPVITTDAGGINDIVENNVTGIIVNQRNSEELAEKIIYLIENEKIRRELSDKAFYRLLEDFTCSRVGEKYQLVLNELIKEKNCYSFDSSASDIPDHRRHNKTCP